MTMPAATTGSGLFGRMFRGDGMMPALPERVRGAVRAEQQMAERTVGWVQMVIIVSFAALYGLSPKPLMMNVSFMMNLPFEPVPWALLAWFGFTAVRLVAAYRRPLPRWLLAASVVIDMSVLMATIWSFHLQYDQPPAFYLKAPTLLYVFILIALRALRFEAGYVILAGLAAHRLGGDRHGGADGRDLELPSPI